MGIGQGVGIFRIGHRYIGQHTGNAFKNGVNLTDAGDFRDFPLLAVISDQRECLILVNAQAVDDSGLNIIVALHQCLTRLIINAGGLRRIVFKVIGATRCGMDAPSGQAFNDQVKRHLNRQHAIDIKAQFGQ